jgi:hypothetical protein
MIDLDTARRILDDAIAKLSTADFASAHVFERNGRELELVLTSRFIRMLKRERLLRSKEVLTALKNASYGFDADRARSEGGRDGIYVVDRDYHPPNEMMRKLFDRFIDRANSGIDDVCAHLSGAPEDLVAVRLVSHHMRLLGVLLRRESRDVLVLVDFDRD